MKFSDLQINSVYRSGPTSILKDLYIPTFHIANRFDRAVGYFSSIALTEAAEGLSVFLKNGGKIRLIVGAPLSSEEEAKIIQGTSLKDLYEQTPDLRDRISQELMAILNADWGELNRKRLDLLSLLIQNGSLELKIALQARGMFHEKIGILYSPSGEKLVFQGSANETGAALLSGMNRESINVFKSWLDREDQYQPHINFFEELWTNNAEGSLVVDIPTAVSKQLYERQVSNPITGEEEVSITKRTFDEITSRQSGPKLPLQHRLFNHQINALKNWQDKFGSNGILSMATGAGKTRTAIHMAVRTFQQRGKICLLVTVPYTPLAEQWADELSQFGFSPIKCFGGVAKWKAALRNAFTNYCSGFETAVCCVAVNDTFSGEQFQSILKTLKNETEIFFIGDECHHLGTDKLLRALPDFTSYRMGLSATFERHSDPIGTDKLLKYFGGVSYEYSMEQAIEDRILSEYLYEVFPISLTETETDEYCNLSAEISSIVARSGTFNRDENSLNSDPNLKILLFKRARLLNNAKNKIEHFKKFIADGRLEPFTIVYCGEGKSNPTDDDDGSLADLDQVDKVTKLIRDNNISVTRFTSREDAAQRKLIIQRFRDGDLAVLTAIRCLDEGIDVPAIKAAVIMASTRNPRQFIQRRGRILRKSQGKTVARLYDYFPVLPSAIVENSQIEKNLFKAELTRIREFANLSKNKAEALEPIIEIVNKYGLVI